MYCLSFIPQVGSHMIEDQIAKAGLFFDEPMLTMLDNTFIL